MLGLENAPAPELEKFTVPEGADFVPAPVSVTVAVHTEPWPAVTLPGTQVDRGRRRPLVTVERDGGLPRGGGGGGGVGGEGAVRSHRW